MSKSIKGTQTEKNLLTSFAGESQARMRYTYFASVTNKSQPSLLKQPIRRKSMRNVCLSFWKAEW